MPQPTRLKLTLYATATEIVSAMNTADAYKTDDAKKALIAAYLEQAYIDGLKAVLKIYEDYGHVKISPAQDALTARITELRQGL